MRRIVNSILLSLLVIFPVTSAVFKKCCPAGQLLDIHRKICIFSEVSNNLAENITEVPTTESYECEQSLRYNFELSIVKGKSSKSYIIDKHIPKLYSAGEACIDEGVNTKTGRISSVAQTCLSCSSSSPCVNYCCPGGMISGGDQCVTVEDNSGSIPGVHHTSLSIRLHCEDSVSYPGLVWNITNTGQMEVDGTVRNLSEYCVEIREQTEPVLLLCPAEDGPVNYKYFIKMIFMSLSMLSFLILIIFHIVIKDLRVINFTKLKIPFFLFLFLSFLLIIITNMVDFTASRSCLFWALFLQYFSLGIFFWLTSMSLDIWLTFRRIANPIQNRKKKNIEQTNKMRRYYIFSFVGPAIVSLVTGTLQLAFTPEEAQYVHPNIGASCMIGQYLPRFLYFHLIILALLIINAVFYCLVVFKFTCGIWKSDSFGKGQMRNFTVFVELVFVMGIHWMSESADFFVAWLLPNYRNHPLIVTLNSINWFSGVFILLLFFSKTSNKNLVRNISCQDEDNLSYYDLAGTFSTQLSDKEEIFKVTNKREAF